jgi:anti-sigma factor RsiW
MRPSHPETDGIEALLAGELDEPAAERVRAHLAGCADCRRELRRLEAERALFQARRAALPPLRSDFEAIRRRVAAAALSRPSVAPAVPRPTRALRAVLAVAASLALVAAAHLAIRHRAARVERWAHLREAPATAWMTLDTGAEALAELERDYGACLIATPSDHPL